MGCAARAFALAVEVVIPQEQLLKIAALLFDFTKSALIVDLPSNNWCESNGRLSVFSEKRIVVNLDSSNQRASRSLGSLLTGILYVAMIQPSTLQSFPLEAGIQAIKDSVNFTDFEAFYNHLLENLPQNSPETRKRYTSLVVRWLFPDRKLGGLLPRAWQSYQDDQLLLELARVTVLEIEPVIARFVTTVIQSMPVGRKFDSAQARDFITSIYGAYKKDSYDRLLVASRQLGFLARLGNKSWVVASVREPTDALLILLHARLAPTPCIVRLSDLLAEPFWRYLGLRQPDEVRAILHDAHAAGLLARYSTVDQLEQVTTRYTLEEYLSRALRLRS